MYDNCLKVTDSICENNVDQESLVNEKVGKFLKEMKLREKENKFIEYRYNQTSDLKRKIDYMLNTGTMKSKIYIHLSFDGEYYTHTTNEYGIATHTFDMNRLLSDEGKTKEEFVNELSEDIAKIYKDTLDDINKKYENTPLSFAFSVDIANSYDGCITAHLITLISTEL
jgi:hypothetical protein